MTTHLAEARILYLCLTKLPELVPGLHLWRQSVGASLMVTQQWLYEMKACLLAGDIRRALDLLVQAADRYVRFGPPRGAADLSGLIEPWGWRLEMECKAINGRVSSDQIRFMENVTKWGGIYYLAKPQRGEDEDAFVKRAAYDIKKIVETKKLGR